MSNARVCVQVESYRIWATELVSRDMLCFVDRQYHYYTSQHPKLSIDIELKLLASNYVVPSVDLHYDYMSSLITTVLTLVNDLSVLLV